MIYSRSQIGSDGSNRTMKEHRTHPGGLDTSLLEASDVASEGGLRERRE